MCPRCRPLRSKSLPDENTDHPTSSFTNPDRSGDALRGVACRSQDDFGHGFLGRGDRSCREDVLGRGGRAPGGPVAVASLCAGRGSSVDRRAGSRRKVGNLSRTDADGSSGPLFFFVHGFRP